MSNEIIATVRPDCDITVSAVGIQGPAGNVNDLAISSMSDTNVTTLENGSVLVYKTNTSKWTSTRLLDQQTMEGGEY